MIRRSSEHHARGMESYGRAEDCGGWEGGRDRVMSPEEEESRHKRTRARHPRPRRPSSLFRGRTVRQTEIKKKSKRIS